MRLTNESCVHNCGRNILSSILDMGQLTNIKQVGRFCSKNVVKSKFKEVAHFLWLGTNAEVKRRQAEACPTGGVSLW
jgi:hypothetical protein